jgi:hypothetical protein
MTIAELALTPSVCCVMGSKTRTIHVAPRPSTTHPTASTAIPACIVGEASRASAACSLRGNARNGIAKAFTKQAAASAAVKASSEPAMGNINRVRLCVVPKPASSA